MPQYHQSQYHGKTATGGDYYGNGDYGNSPQRSRGVFGLPNTQLTCYMNAVLQCLVHLDTVSSVYAFDAQNAGDDGGVLGAFRQLCHQLWSMNKVTPEVYERFVRRFTSANPHFCQGHQHDATEFLLALVEAVDDGHVDGIKALKGRMSNTLISCCKDGHRRHSAKNEETTVLFPLSIHSGNDELLTGMQSAKETETPRKHPEEQAVRRRGEKSIQVEVILGPNDVNQYWRYKVDITSEIRTYCDLGRYLKFEENFSKTSYTIVYCEIGVQTSGNFSRQGFTNIFFESNPINIQETTRTIYAIPVIKENKSVISIHSNGIPDMISLPQVLKNPTLQADVLNNNFLEQVKKFNLNHRASNLSQEMIIRIITNSTSTDRVEKLKTEQIRDPMKFQDQFDKSKIVFVEIRWYGKAAKPRFDSHITDRIADDSANGRNSWQSDHGAAGYGQHSTAAGTRSGQGGFGDQSKDGRDSFTGAAGYGQHSTVAGTRSGQGGFGREELLTLEDSIRGYFGPSSIEGAHKCHVCGEAAQLDDFRKLVEVPKILIFQLNRFPKFGSSVSKIDRMVKYPLELDMGGHLEEKNKKHIYQLCGVVKHVGTFQAGHYTAFVRNPVDGRFYDFDDNRHIRMISEDRLVSKDAYMLFYEWCSPAATNAANPHWSTYLEPMSYSGSKHAQHDQGAQLQDRNHSNGSLGARTVVDIDYHGSAMSSTNRPAAGVSSTQSSTNTNIRY